MTRNTITALLLYWIFMFPYVVLGSVMIAMGLENNALKGEAIERGYAQHNPVTGEWEWVEND